MKKKITRRAFCSMLLALPFPARAQQPKKVSRIGYLTGGDLASDSARSEGIRLALRERGYTEGQNIAFEYRFNENKGAERRSELAAELVRLKVDLIVVTGTAAALDAKKATGTIPILMVNPGDPVGDGLVASLARPGGNVTGFSTLGTELIPKG